MGVATDAFGATKVFAADDPLLLFGADDEAPACTSGADWCCRVAAAEATARAVGD
ncbi:MAG TPA: hypothetical protein VLE99_04940 [Candidatus Saccharimonadales bacterium]|nr:hypothetical protein [Candidatus Saccharimonadales bacterium]